MLNHIWRKLNILEAKLKMIWNEEIDGENSYCNLPIILFNIQTFPAENKNRKQQFDAQIRKRARI